MFNISLIKAVKIFENNSDFFNRVSEHFTGGGTVVMIGAPNLRNPGPNGTLTNGSRSFQCHPEGESEATITLTLVGLGIVANTVLMALIIFNKHLRR